MYIYLYLYLSIYIYLSIYLSIYLYMYTRAPQTCSWRGFPAPTCSAAARGHSEGGGRVQIELDLVPTRRAAARGNAGGGVE